MANCLCRHRFVLQFLFLSSLLPSPLRTSAQRIRRLGHLLSEKGAEAAERGLHVLLQVFHVERAARTRILAALPLRRVVEQRDNAQGGRRRISPN